MRLLLCADRRADQCSEVFEVLEISVGLVAARRELDVDKDLVDAATRVPHRGTQAALRDCDE
jgi:hypothetical protein